MFYSSNVYKAIIPVGRCLESRGMATLKETSMRLKSISSISKITKSMKMIASTKVNKAQAIMLAARQYAEVTTALLSIAELDKTADNNKRLYVIISSDRGLCGSIHSGITRYMNAKLPNAPDSRMVIIGQKARTQLSRLSANKILLSYDQVSKTLPTWIEAAAIASEIIKILNEFDVVTIVYNKFKSVISFEVKEWVIPKFKKDLVDYPKLNAYDYDADSFEDYKSFLLANLLYSAISEGYASEMAARRTAMENATNNAQEMIRTLTLSYNRSRQAAITNELIDIITGASAI